MADSFPLDIILRTVDRTSGGFGKAMSNLDKLSAKTIKVGKSMTTNLTLPIVGLGVAAVKSFSEFESGMSNVATLVDTSAESMEDMSKNVLAIGSRTPVAIDKLTSALFDLRSGGISAGDAMNVLEQSSRLGVAGLGSTQQAANLVTGAINAFGLEGEKADRVYDNIFKTTKNGITTISGLSQSFGAVAGVVAATGTEFDEFMAATSALTTTTLPASQAQTQLRAVISGLTRDTKETSKVFKKLGAKDFKDLIAKSGGLVPALSAITGELDNNEAKILKLVGSTEAMGAVLGLTGAQNGKFTETLKDMRVGANAVDEAFEKQNKTTAAQWQRTKNSLTSAAISMGTVLAPAVTKLAGKVQELAGWFGNLDDSTKETIVKFAGVVAAAGPTLLIFGKLTMAIKAISLAVAANPLGILIGGLVAIKALTGDSWSTLFSDAIEFWKKSFMEFFDWLSDSIRSAADEFRRFTIGGIGEKGGPLDQARQQLKDEAQAKDLGEDAFGQGNLDQRLEAAREASDSDRRFAELAARPFANDFRATAPPPGSTKNHVMIELVGKTDGVRVKSIKGEDMIDVKTGNQGG